MKCRTQFTIIGGLLLCGASAPLGIAAALYSGTIGGTFASPVLTGTLINVDRTTSSMDNTTTAIFTGIGTNTVTWGTNVNVPPPPIFSRFVFSGNTIANQAANTPFALGTFRYLNGTSATDSLIFGITLNLSFSGNGMVTPETSKIAIVTTLNGGVDKFADADFASFDKFPNTFNVFEGAESTATLVGMIVGDPQLQLTGITLAPNDPNGFLALGQPNAIPEPASAAMIGCGLASLALIGLLRRALA